MQFLNLDLIVEQFKYNPDAPMIFNSGFFLWLFVGFMTVYAFLHRNLSLKIAFCTLFSIYFYYKSSGMYFLILLLSTFIDYWLAILIDKANEAEDRQVEQGVILDTQRRKAKNLVILSCFVNLGILGYFKYTNFLVGSILALFNQPFDPFNIFLPVGISFFTFQSLSYTIDVYRKELKPIHHIVDYAFFVSFFPQLVAGPIVRASDFLPQVRKPTFISAEMLGRGVFLIACGLFKKAIISDYISLNYVDRIFDNPTLYSGVENLIGLYGYALQIYCDFSGYSDMAIGIALLLGYEFNINFNSPYQSSSITEFWRRWHISLSTWLRDYLYISLGGNRKGRIRTYINLLITMLLGGLWHGAAFRFIVWGALHGIALALDKFIKENIKLPNTNAIRVLGMFFTFHFVCFAWIFFRAADMTVAAQMINQILFEFNPLLLFQIVWGYPLVIALMILGYFLHLLPKSLENLAQNEVTRIPLIGKAALLVIVILLVIQVKSSEIQPFIYFQF